MMNKLSIDDIDVLGKRVLVRVDFNVPLDEKVQIADDTRIRESIPTIERLLEKGARVILMSHLGRPKGKKNPALSLMPCARRLSEILNRQVIMADDCVGETVTRLVSELNNGDIALLENLRFYKEEESNDRGFAEKLATLGDLYVNDAFGTAHRAHASTEGITHFFEQNAAGYLMVKEIEYLGKTLAHPARPFVAIIGGAKISGKIDVIENLLQKVDSVLIGGGMAFTFAKAQGLEIGKSLCEADKVDMARSLVEKAQQLGKNLLLPIDCIVSSEFNNEAPSEVVLIDKIPASSMGLDIGPKTIEIFRSVVVASKTVVWNGPMGVFEMPNFATGTKAIAESLVEATGLGATTIVGGGDSAAALDQLGLNHGVTHVSTGGGASLEFLEGKSLPGLMALTDH